MLSKIIKQRSHADDGYLHKWDLCCIFAKNKERYNEKDVYLLDSDVLGIDGPSG
ncbi:MAG: hypothetical protein IJV11_11080 [Muribaculaceae bacterium]|nr:hypothetical protein [Muribaculaceae bacterium]